jgi:hypothetical protein
MSLIPEVAGRRSQKKERLGLHLHMSFSPRLESLGYPWSAALWPGSFTSLKEAAECWDKHGLTDYWEFTKEVEVDIEFLGLHKPSYWFVS